MGPRKEGIQKMKQCQEKLGNFKPESLGLDAKKDGKGKYLLVSVVVCIGIHLNERPLEVHVVREAPPTIFQTHE